VVNPDKDHKLTEVASRHGINEKVFQRVSHQLRRVWPLFP
jgi:DNA-binding IscR family transcriptional regulator